MRSQTSASRSGAGGGNPLSRNGAGSGDKFEPAMTCFEQQRVGSTAKLQDPSGDDGPYEAIASSSCGDGKGRVVQAARPLRLQCCDCEELLHELANVITGVLMQSQLVAWKLPPYSHLKRSIREIERNAQRGSELIKRIMRRLGDDEGHAGGQQAPIQTSVRESLHREALPPHKRL